jgi:hypothetical protein
VPGYAFLCRFYSSPRNPAMDEIKANFASINSYIDRAGGWLVSVPGDPEMRFQALTDSPLPALLEGLGYIVERTGETQRILPHAIVEKFETSSSGTLVTAVEGSTRAATTRVTHAGIAVVVQLNLRLP